MKGTVRSWDDKKGFGHIRSEGGGKEVFLHHSALRSVDDRKQLGPGSEVEFELETPEPAKGPKAKNGTVLTQGHAPATTPPVVPQGLVVSWTFGESTSRKEDLSVPIWVKAIRGNKPVGGTEVNLKADGVAQGGPVVTDEDGEAFFRVYLIPDAIGCDLLATVDDKNFTHRWDLPKKPVFKPTKLDIEDTKIADGHYQLTFSVYDEAGNPGPATIRLVFDQECALNGKTDRRHDLPVPSDTGTLTVEVNFARERVHYDAFVLESDIKQKNLTLLGPKPERKPARPGDGLLAHLTDGWE